MRPVLTAEDFEEILQEELWDARRAQVLRGEEPKEVRLDLMRRSQLARALETEHPSSDEVRDMVYHWEEGSVMDEGWAGRFPQLCALLDELFFRF